MSSNWNDGPGGDDRRRDEERTRPPFKGDDQAHEAANEPDVTADDRQGWRPFGGTGGPGGAARGRDDARGGQGRPPFGGRERSFGERESRPPFRGDRDARPFDRESRPPFRGGDRPAEGGPPREGRPPFARGGDRPPFRGDRDARPFNRDARPFERESRPPFRGDRDARPPFRGGDRDGGPFERGERDSRPAERDARPFGERESRPFERESRPPFRGDREGRPPFARGGERDARPFDRESRPPYERRRPFERRDEPAPFEGEGRPLGTATRQGRNPVQQFEQIQGDIYGRWPVLESLRAGKVTRIFLAAGVHDGADHLQEIQATAEERHIPVVRVERLALDRALGGVNHQGIAAATRPFEYVPVEQVLAAAQAGETQPLVVVFDGVQDPQNLGSILRTADAAGAHGAMLPKHHQAGVTPAVLRASAGAAEHLPIAEVTNLRQTIEQLKEAGYWIVGLDMEGGTDYDNFDVDYPLALIVGAEGRGLGRLVTEHCDYLVRLPMRGHIASLNASVATGIVLYEIQRRRGEAGKHPKGPRRSRTQESGLSGTGAAGVGAGDALTAQVGDVSIADAPVISGVDEASTEDRIDSAGDDRVFVHADEDAHTGALGAEITPDRATDAESEAPASGDVIAGIDVHAADIDTLHEHAHGVTAEGADRHATDEARTAHDRPEMIDADEHQAIAEGLSTSEE